MSSVSEPGGCISRIERELYFLIVRFLSAGPCHGAAKILLDELEHHQVSLYRHIRSDHLLKICQRIVPLLEKEVPPSVTGVASLLGAGRQSMLRTIEDVKHIRWKPEVHIALRHDRPLAPPHNLAHPPNLIHILNARSMIGQQRNDHACCTKMFSHMTRLSRSLGHLSAVYCLCFDKTGEYFITGADDHLIKIWSALSGRLLGTLRGHSAEITDMAVNYENTLLASGSCDKFVRVWCLRSLAPVAVLHGHSGMVTSLQFCPYQRGNTRFLASTGGDGGVCFWKWQVDTNKFDTKPIKFVEKSRAGAQMLCSSFSPGGIFLTTGNSDQVVRVYSLAGPQIEKICELEAHMDRIDSISYSNSSSRFVTGSKDGFARIWRFERQEWKNIVLNTSKQLDSKPGEIELVNEVFRVTMVCWNADDTKVITAVSDCSLKVWDSYTGELLKILKCHQDEVFVLEHHPLDPRVILSAGHDGNIIIWDIEKGIVVKKYFNNIQGQGHGAVFDCKWAPDGLSFAATDSHGFIMYFGYGSNEIYQRLPEDMFFHTDYRPLIRDANNFILDEQTQQPPHLMPPPFLVDIDGNPHPPRYQRLVPGRENCQDTQLIPQLGVLPNGDREVLDDILEVVEQASAEAEAAEAAAPSNSNASGQDQEDGDRIIDVMIERLLQEQNERMAAAGGRSHREAADHGSGGEDLHSPRRDGPLSPAIRGLRRSGEEQGVRQASGNVPVSRRATARDLANWRRRVVIRELDPAQRRCVSKKLHQMSDFELKRYLLERKRKPLPQSEDSSDSNSYMKTRHRKQAHHGEEIRACINEETTVNRLATRALYDTEEEAEDSGDITPEEDLEAVVLPGEESDQMWKSSSDSESSDYSDWTADAGLNLEPPKRKSGRQVKRPHLSSTEDDTEDEDDEDDDGHESRDEEFSGLGTSKRTQARKQAVAKKKPPKQTKRERKQQKKKQKLLNQQGGITELPDAFKIPEWLTESVPRKSPYFPQMGDEVVYFRQGHELYLKAVKMRNAYKVDISRNQPWHKIPGLKEMELVKVVGLKYEVKPPRLVCLKLALIDPDTHKQTGGKFSVKYHDMADVIDFIILKQNYDIAMSRNWNVGDRFRSLIDDAWWMGVIESKSPFQEEYPDSMFQCFTVHWDNGEVEKMSPWDLEPICEDRLPRNKGGSVPVTESELAALTYKPKPSDWPPAGQDIECDRISQALDKVMELSIAEHFLAPVDLNAFPIYGMIIAYPVDLSLIKSRLEKRFYRRVNSIQFDVRHIESNAVAFNEPKSRIVKLAKQVTELCLRVISDTDCFDPMPIYNEIVKDADFAIPPSDQNHLEHNGHSEDINAPGPSSSTRSSSLLQRTQKLEVSLSPNAWKAQCRQLLDIMFDCEDSKPFHHPVDPIQYPEYYQIIDHPMDLGTIKEQIDCDGYETPVEFCKDVRLVFNNSRKYNTNKRSRIYAMTLRLSAMFEDQIRDIISGWKQASKGCRRMSKRHLKPRKTNQSSASSSLCGYSNSPHSSFLCLPSTSASSKATSSGSSGVSNKGKAISKRPDVSAKVSRRIIHDSDDDDEVDVVKNDDSENEDDSDSDYNDKKAKPIARLKNTHKKMPSRKGKGDKRLVNGTGKRYSTRVATGSIQRKNYNRVLSDHSNPDNDSADESGEERILRKSSSKAVVNHPQILPKGSSRRRARLASDSDDNVKPRAKHRKVQFETSEEEEEEKPAPKRVTQSQRLRKNSKGSKYNHIEKEEEEDDEQSDMSGPVNTDESATSNSSEEEQDDDDEDEEEEAEEEEEEEEEEAELNTRTTRSSSRKISPTQDKHSRDDGHDDFVSTSRSSSTQRYRTRNCGQRTVVYREDSEENEGPSEEEVTSVSSRGRIRRITPRARALFS